METEVKFRLVGGANPLILIPAFMNGHGPFECILDTGAATSLLTPELAERLNTPLQEVTDAYGAGGKISVSLTCLESLAVGEARAETLQVAVTEELNRIATYLEAEIQGNVGYDFLKRFRLSLDYQQSLLRLTEGDDTETRGGVAFILAAPAKPLILLPVFLNDAGPYRFVLDTGASATVVAPEIAGRLGIELQESTPIKGAGGQIPASYGAVTSLRVGEHEVRNTGVVASGFLEMLSGVCGTEIEGVLGYNFLREFLVTIDYPHSTLILQ